MSPTQAAQFYSLVALFKTIHLISDELLIHNLGWCNNRNALNVSDNQFLQLSACVHCESCGEASIGPHRNHNSVQVCLIKSDQSESPEPAWKMQSVRLSSALLLTGCFWCGPVMLSSVFWCENKFEAAVFIEIAALRPLTSSLDVLKQKKNRLQNIFNGHFSISKPSEITHAHIITKPRMDVFNTKVSHSDCIHHVCHTLFAVFVPRPF